jgi:hypothetical protein
VRSLRGLAATDFSIFYEVINLSILGLAKGNEMNNNLPPEILQLI